ncbi:MAG TPA: DJ-1/PfpI family protein [Hyphomicrobiales bacterium]|nr:DJ-1/PfpI family protein [Kaistiaceae bacterium]HQF30655.1 DJ-1/PfpI family protein [Hyphomicrobiales bacterium]
MTGQPFRILFAIFPGMTQLDFTGPHQFLSRLPESEVIVASPAGGDVPSEGLVFAGAVPIAEVAACDLLCVPGGMAATKVALDAAFIAEIRRLAAGARYVTSVCTGSLILGAAGLLQGRRAACHWAWRELLPVFGAIPDGARVVRDGNVITGGGVTAGIDFALVVLAEVAGRNVAEAVQLGLEYAPEPPFESGRPELADPAIVAAVRARLDRFAADRRAAAAEAAARFKSAADQDA